jgi:cation transport ATPase
MNRFKVNLDFNDFRTNMQALEKQGKTVVCMTVNKIPRLLISLEEEHLVKAEALSVVTYFRDVMKLKVAMITGDNKHAAEKVAAYLDIPTCNVTHSAYPNGKKRMVEQF